MSLVAPRIIGINTCSVFFVSVRLADSAWVDSISVFSCGKKPIVPIPGNKPVKLDTKINKKNVATNGKIDFMAFFEGAMLSVKVYKLSIIGSTTVCNPEDIILILLERYIAKLIKIKSTNNVWISVLVIGSGPR